MISKYTSKNAAVNRKHNYSKIKMGKQHSEINVNNLTA